MHLKKRVWMWSDLPCKNTPMGKNGWRYGNTYNLNANASWVKRDEMRTRGVLVSLSNKRVYGMDVQVPVKRSARCGDSDWVK